MDNLVKTFQFVPKEAEGYFWDELFKMLLYGEIPIVQGFASHYQPGKHSQNGDTYEKYIGQLPCQCLGDGRLVLTVTLTV